MAPFPDPSSSYFAAEAPLDKANYNTHFPAFNAPDAYGFPADFHADAGQAQIWGEDAARGSGGAQYYHTRSINDGVPHAQPWPLAGDLSLRTPNIAASGDAFLGHPEALALLPRESGHAHHPAGAFHPSYHPLDSGRGYARAKSVALPSPAPRPHPPITTHDFVHMNEAFISTDLPEESPFALIPADGRAAPFSGHPYPDGHQWPQTFKITEVKQIGPKKQTLACFFCRARKIACAPRPVDGTEDERSCEYVVDFVRAVG
ncbi:hypothetical protein B0H17DRAFT_1124976 [Mycena rosella]|uniref:Uncharacterized protein n=1 Tax=Mycena rosella TaxID=1033263 RepID=A0AAD7MAG0_MYCRO|nr:hypothetical protein B0H17DRAFT_1124976 [Mycena rosella]